MNTSEMKVAQLKEKIAQLEKENQELKTLLNHHENDESFGILTRKGLDSRLKEIEKERVVCFLDLDNMKSLNEVFGYKEVDKKVKTLFSCIRESDVIIGRYFSGDEIVIILPKEFKNIILDRLYQKSLDLGLFYTLSHETWIGGSGCDINETINFLAQKVMAIKTKRQKEKV